MKLITKIIGICSLMVLVSSVAVSAVIWGMIRQSRLDEAYVQAQQDTLLVLSKLERGISREIYSSADSIYLEYVLKQENDPFNICYWEIRQGEITEIYNRTVLTIEQLDNME